MNDLSYAYHYRQLDSTTVYAQRALEGADGYESGRAEALNNLAFVSIMHMEYATAYEQLEEVRQTTDNQIELLVADVQNMRLCQRESKNKDFYDYRESALRRMRRIDEEWYMLSERERARMVYAQSEFSIVASTYFYYVGLEQQSVDALAAIHDIGGIERDTAQYLNYLYNVGAGGIITEGTPEQVSQTEFDYLMRCFLLAQGRYPYWEAQSLQAISEHLQGAQTRQRLMYDNMPAMKFINTDGMPDTLLAGNLAQRSLDIFKAFGDVYQTAGAYRTLAQCYWELGDYRSSLICLNKALEHNKAIGQAPDLVASIREQLSVVYAAIDDKENSDLNRNIYLDLQEQTRQDRQLEARAAQLDKSSQQLNWMIFAVIAMIVLVVILLLIFDYWRRRENRKQSYLDDLNERYEETLEKCQLSQCHLRQNKKIFLEQRAKVSLVNSITPFIDRILHEVDQMKGNEEDRQEYIRELTDKINDYNNVLTRWIQIRQGELNLHIESFPLQSLFDILLKSSRSFLLKGIDLSVVPTADVVKADRTLTLFMLNTLADNARKYTPKGGKVCVESRSGDDYVEISVSDTGIGISEQKLAHLFDHTVIRDERTPQLDNSAAGTPRSHGFGLMNCKGIIEKYRKSSRIFNVCAISAESEEGKGSRISFRLPKGVVRTIIGGVMLLLASTPSLFAQSPQHPSPIIRAAAYADSAYFCNLNGHYKQALQNADSALMWLQRCKNQPALRDSVEVITLDVRNESAVASLALHEWDRYRYNNKLYTQLFRERSADNTLGDYVRTMQQSESNKTVAVILLIMLLLLLFPAYYFMYYRHRLIEQFSANEERLAEIEMAEDDYRKTDYENAQLHISNSVLDNCLSTLKHETMYYPSRIRQLVDSDDSVESLREVVDYYKELYTLLSAQATRQTERIKLNISILDDLFDILQRENGGKKLQVAFEENDDRYVTCQVRIESLHLSESQCQELFTPQTVNVQYLVCRQIVRDLGEITHARGCGIQARPDADGTTLIEIILANNHRVKTILGQKI